MNLNSVFYFLMKIRYYDDGYLETAVNVDVFNHFFESDSQRKITMWHPLLITQDTIYLSKHEMLFDSKYTNSLPSQ